MKGGGSQPSRYFLHYAFDDSSRFVKIVPAAHSPRQLAVNKLAAWLIARGVATVNPLSGFPRQLDEERLMFAYDYVPGRFATMTVEDIKSIGHGIGRLHNVLSALPNTDDIRAQSTARNAMLGDCADRIFSASNESATLGRLHSILRTDRGLLTLLNDAPDNQPIHGDLVYANVLFPEDGGEPLIFDFEDTLISWLPPELDLAQAIERFVLVPGLDEGTSVNLGRAFLRAYANQRADAWRGFAVPLDRLLCLLSLRALLTLAAMESTASPATLDEWEKFFFLYDQAKIKRPLTTVISEGFGV